MKKKLYISGAVTSVGEEKANYLFEEAEEIMKLKYFTVNPKKLTPFVNGKKWEEYMVDDIRLLLSCEAIYMLKNWCQSKGARIEYVIAKEMGKEIIFQ